MTTTASLDTAFSSLFETNMGIHSGERVLIFSDTIRADENVSPADLDRRTRLNATAHAAAVYAAEKYGCGTFVEFPSTSASGVEPPLSLWNATFGDETVTAL
ncbi:MAG: peptidase, partial [Pseudomonadota bacterium]